MKGCEKFQKSKVHKPFIPHSIPAISFYKLGLDPCEQNEKLYLNAVLN